MSSSRIAGAITKATHDQWTLARRCQAAHIQNLVAGIRTLRHRLSLPIGEPGTKRAAGGYRSKNEWFRKSRRLAALEDRHAAAVADWQAGRVRVVRGGKRLLNTRHHLTEARLTEDEWRQRWEAERWFIAADGESGKRFGNETIRVTPNGEVSIKLPAPLAHLANTRHGRYILTARIAFAHRGAEWADHFAAYRLDRHGNPVGDPHRFGYDLSAAADPVLCQQRQRVQQVQAQPVHGLRHSPHVRTVRGRPADGKRHAAHRLERVSLLDRHQVSLPVKFPPNS